LNQIQNFTPDFRKKIEQLLFDGMLFMGDENRFFIPIIFLYFMSADRNSINNDITPLCNDIFCVMMQKAIRGAFNSTDFEEFVLKFFRLKYLLFQKAGIEEVLLSDWFQGALMKSSLRKHELHLPILKHSMKFSTAAHPADDIDSLRAAGPFGGKIDARNPKSSHCIHIGKSNEYCDGLLTFGGEFSILIEAKYSESLGRVLPFSGNDRDSFEHEQKMFQQSKLHLEKNLFLYITNAGMGKVNAVDLIPELQEMLNAEKQKHRHMPRGEKTEHSHLIRSLESRLETAKKRAQEVENLMDERSIIVHAGNWRKLFSSIFIFLSKHEWASKEEMFKCIDEEK
jgi:hypothetical protein